jgi:hypothetical protein
VVYLDEGERAFLYDRAQLKYWEIEYPEDELPHLSRGAYLKALHAMGVRPVIDL